MPKNEEQETDTLSNRKIRSLERHLGNLAAERREYSSPERQAEIVQEYHATIHQLEALGWDGIIDWDSELAPELMPEGYRRDPRIQTNWSFPPPRPSLLQRLKALILGRS